MSERIKLLIEAGEHSRDDCPVSIDLPWSYKEIGHVTLKEEASGKIVPCQVSKSQKGAAKLHWIVDNLKAGEIRAYIAEKPNEHPVAGKKSIRCSHR